jgi:hypothetical protein
METTKFNVIDRQTGLVVGTYSTIRSARAAANRKDLAYGAIRYGVEKASA